VRFVQARYGVALDFQPHTLALVDHWVYDARTQLGARPEAADSYVAAAAFGPTADLVQTSAGAYLGEVIRRSFRGAWKAAGEFELWRLCLSEVYCAFNPIGMVREALYLEPSVGWHSHFELDPGEQEFVEQRFLALPQVAADEYYAPSTRFDVVELLVEALRASMQARGLADVRFSPADYA
jgi:hypothetical protein